MSFPEKIHVCLVCDDVELKEAVGAGYLDPHEVRHFSLKSIVNEQGDTTPLLNEIGEVAAEFDVVLVDWHLQQAPLVGMLSYRIRQVPAPLIALCKDKVEDQVAALIVGADDVVTLPFSDPLLRAHVVAHLRSLRSAGKDLSSSVSMAPSVKEDRRSSRESEVLQHGALRLDIKKFRLYVRKTTVKLTPRQFDLLRFLMENHDVLVSRDEILEHVWEINFDTGTNMVDVYIHFLRRLLKSHRAEAVIETVRGKGYRFSVPDLADQDD